MKAEMDVIRTEMTETLQKWVEGLKKAQEQSAGEMKDELARRYEELSKRLHEYSEKTQEEQRTWMQNLKGMQDSIWSEEEKREGIRREAQAESLNAMAEKFRNV